MIICDYIYIGNSKFLFFTLAEVLYVHFEKNYILTRWLVIAIQVNWHIFKGILTRIPNYQRIKTSVNVEISCDLNQFLNVLFLR